MKQYESKLTHNFRSRVNKAPVATNRYLWHIGNMHDDTNYKIAAEGLTCYLNFAVFAHNNITCFDHTYPVFIDRNIFWEGPVFPLLESYSFWRIDTQVAQVDWFEDPNMQEEISVYGLSTKKASYVCSFDTIPNTALQLFYFDTKTYFKKKTFKIAQSIGVTSIVHSVNDFATLLPVTHINNYLAWKIAQKAA